MPRFQSVYRELNRKNDMRNWGAGLCVGGLVVVVSCTSLPSDVRAGKCGDGVLGTPEKLTKYCDTFPKTLPNATNTICIPAGQPGECHYACARQEPETRGSMHAVVSPSSATTVPLCPPEAGCGADSVCRVASGAYEAEVVSPSLADKLYVGDFDADTISDVVERSRVEMKVHYGDVDRRFAQTFSIRAPDVYPNVDTFAGQTQSDLGFVASSGVAIWKGQTDQTLFPTAFSTFDEHTKVKLVPLTFLTPGLDKVFIFGDDPAIPFAAQTPGYPTGFQLDVIDLGDSAPPPPLYVLPTGAVDAFAGDPIAAAFREDVLPIVSPCDEIVMAFTGDKAVHVLSPCRTDAFNRAIPNFAFVRGTYTADPAYQPPSDVNLPSGLTVTKRGMRVGDADGDGHLDLVINCANSAKEPVAVIAYGAGDGTFNSKRLPPGPPPPRDNQGSVLPQINLEVLAFGLITADRETDFVFPSKIVLNAPGPSDGGMPDGGADAGSVSQIQDVTFFAPNVLWTEAQLQDINRDGTLDVIAASARSIDVYLGSPRPLLDHFPFAVAGAATNLGFGDLDGDSILDIAYKVQGDPFTMSEDSLGILFGKPQGAPEAPVVVARLPKIEQVVVSTLGGGFSQLHQTLASVGLVARGRPGRTAGMPGLGGEFLSVLEGSTDREIQAPFLFRTSAPGGAVVPITVAGGIFTQTRLAASPKDLAAIVVEGVPNAAQSIDFNVKVYTAAATGPAAFRQFPAIESPSLEALSATSQAFDWNQASLATINLDASPAGSADGVVILVPPNPLANNKQQGRLLVLQIRNGAWATLVDTLLGSNVSARAAAWQLNVTDVNRDGHDDVIVLSDGNGDKKDASQINVYWGQSGPTDKPIDVTKSALIPSPKFPLPSDAPLSNPGNMTSFTTIIADGSASPQIFGLTEALGVYAARRNGLEFIVTDAQVTGLSAPVFGFDGGAANNLFAGGKAIVAGDFDGDGIDDVAIVASKRLQFFHGVPVIK